MENQDNQTIILKNEDGEEREFELVCTLSVEENEYAILADLDSEAAVAMRIEGEG